MKTTLPSGSSDFELTHDGFYLGGSYSWPLTKTGTLSLSGAYAWLEAEIQSWHGITLTNGRITGLDLSSNNLNGKFPGDIHFADQIGDMNLAINNLTGSVPGSANSA